MFIGSDLMEGVLCAVLGAIFVFYTTVILADPLSMERITAGTRVSTPLGFTILGLFSLISGVGLVRRHFKEKRRWAEYEEQRLNSE